MQPVDFTAGRSFRKAQAKELVTQARIGESADMVWRQVQEQNRQMQSPASNTNVAEAREPSLLQTVVPPATAIPALSRVPEIIDSKQASVPAEQLPLF